MKKRFIIILIIQTVLILSMMVFAFIQKLEADKNMIEAQRQEKIAKEATVIANSLKLELEKLKAEKDNQSK